MILLKFKKINDNAVLPTKKNPSDAGFDLYAVKDTFILAKSQETIHTGLQLADVITDAPIVIQLWSKSGLDSEHALHVGAGIVDQGYRGEVLVLLKNTSDNNYMVEKGDKVAQLIPVYIPEVIIEETDEIIEADRGNDGGILRAVWIKDRS